MSSSSEQNEQNEEEGNIRHLVLSGGVIYAFSFYGAIQRLHQQKWLNVYDIETIHATSAGALVGTILALWCIRDTETLAVDIDWATLDNYFIQRPWQQVFKFSLDMLLQCYDKCGLFGTEIFEEILRPLFSARDLNISTITMHEFYQLTHIEHHFFSVSLHDATVVDISYKTHPEWRVLDAVYASSCAPFLFRPLIYNKETYVDGYFMANYPIEPCLQWCDERDIPRDTILGIHLLSECPKKNREEENDASGNSTIGMNLLEYVQILLKQLMTKTNKEDYKSQEVRPYEIDIQPTIRLFEVNRVANSQEERQHLIDIGAKHADQFMQAISHHFLDEH
jgi:predicted acylesterase/phospholipase RssA